MFSPYLVLRRKYITNEKCFESPHLTHIALHMDIALPSIGITFAVRREYKILREQSRFRIFPAIASEMFNVYRMNASAKKQNQNCKGGADEVAHRGGKREAREGGFVDWIDYEISSRCERGVSGHNYEISISFISFIKKTVFLINRVRHFTDATNPGYAPELTAVNFPFRSVKGTNFN